MVNLIAGRRIVPELIQEDCTAERIAAEVLSLLTDVPRAEAMRARFPRCAASWDGPGASGRAADAVLEVVRSRRSNM